MIAKVGEIPKKVNFGSYLKSTVECAERNTSQLNNENYLHKAPVADLHAYEDQDMKAVPPLIRASSGALL